MNKQNFNCTAGEFFMWLTGNHGTKENVIEDIYTEYLGESLEHDGDYYGFAGMWNKQVEIYQEACKPGDSYNYYFELTINGKVEFCGQYNDPAFS